MCLGATFRDCGRATCIFTELYQFWKHPRTARVSRGFREMRPLLSRCREGYAVPGGSVGTLAMPIQNLTVERIVDIKLSRSTGFRR